MRVKDWMSAGLITVDVKTGLSEAWDLMRERRIRHLLVMEGPRLVGIISDRDIRLTLPSPATSLSAWEINHLLMSVTVDRVMTRSPITIAADRPVSEAVALMLEHRIGALPVFEGHGLCGIITQTDVLLAFPAALHEGEHPAAPAAVPAATPQAPSRRILVPLDRIGDHTRVLTAARELAKKAPAVLRLLHVTPDPVPVVVEGRTVSYSDQEAARVEHEVVVELRAAAAALTDIPVEFAVRLGSPAEEIVREAEAVNADLIIMATHRRTGMRRLLQGSVAEDVERATKLPVLLVPYDDESGDDTPAPASPEARP
jgi:acetoin utilization protein AcuB